MQLEKSCTMEGNFIPHGPKGPIGISKAVALGLCLFLLPAIPSSQAEFNLNFKPDEKNNNGTAGTSVSYSSNDAYVACYVSFSSNNNCGNDISGSHDDPSGFFQRMFRDTTTNKWFYQVIIGDYAAGDNFALEYIIAADSTYGSAWDSSDMYRTASAYNGTTSQNTSNQLYNMAKPYDVAGSDSLKTGTGTGNPTKVIMHQFLKDADTEMVFLKDVFANKPLMTQKTTNGSDMISTWITDARALDYTTLNPTPVPATDTVINYVAINPLLTRHTNITKKAGAGITNTVTLGGALIYGTEGDYNYATDNQTSNLTNGRYTYTAGTEEGGSNGTYTYIDAANGDDFFPSGVDYANFCQSSQNPNWSGSGACKNIGGTGGGGGWDGKKNRDGKGW